jgi:Na+/H+ antiporter NhaA
MSKKQDTFTVSFTLVGPALLAGWYYTQATQFLFIFGLLQVIGLLLISLAIVMLIFIIPKLENKDFTHTVTEMKRGIDNPIKYLVYPLTFVQAGFLMYFEHYTLFTLVFIGTVMGLVLRQMSKWAIEAALKGAQE